MAARNIGRVIAQRCLQSGLTNMVLFEPEASETSEKVHLTISVGELVVTKYR